MSNSKVRPRHDQVAELTRGVRLPMPSIPQDHLEIIAEGLRCAFRDIRNSHLVKVANGEEQEVTALMQARLTRLIQENTLWRQLVFCVGRGQESINFDGSHLEKRPDLSIVLTGPERRFPLIAEAKIVDAVRAKTVGLYCKNGIRRFVEGEYAWANQEALMIAYVRDGSLIDPALKSYLSKVAASHPRRYLTKTLPVPIGPGISDLAHTQHDRKFSYGSQQPPNNPGPITIWHLWLN